MKKASLFLFIFLLGVGVKGFSQTIASTATTPAAGASDFFVGKWEILVVGTPDGDTKFVTELVRKDGKLTGELKDPAGTRPATPITKVVEDADKKLTIYFNTDQAGEIPIELAKVDDDHLRGKLFDMFDATAVRVKK